MTDHEKSFTNRSWVVTRWLKKTALGSALYSFSKSTEIIYLVEGFAETNINLLLKLSSLIHTVVKT